MLTSVSSRGKDKGLRDRSAGECRWEDVRRGLWMWRREAQAP